MKRLVALVLVLTVAMAVSAYAVMSTKRSDASDRRATDTFVRATYVFNNQLASTFPNVDSIVGHYVTSIIGECPHVMVGAPRGDARGALNLEVLMAPVLASVDAQGTIIRAYIDSIASLKWSEPKLTRLVGTSVGELQAELRVVLPNTCADIRLWIKNNYRRVPAATERFNQEFPFPTREFPEGGGGEFLGVGPQPINRFTKALSPYEDIQDRAVLDDLERIESEVSRARHEMRSEDAKRLTQGLRLDPNFRRSILGE
jgi:hypothetical protein